MSESSSTHWPTSGSTLDEGGDKTDLTEGLGLGFDGAEDILRVWRQGMRPDPDLTVSEWADKHRKLSSRASAEPGQYRTARTPYLRAIMDALSPNDTVIVVETPVVTPTACCAGVTSPLSSEDVT